MDLASYFDTILRDEKYQEWERELRLRVESRTRAVLAEQQEDTKWNRGFIEGMKFVLDNPHNIVKARDTKTPDAKG